MSLKLLNLFALTLILVLVLSCNITSKKQLPIYNPSDFKPKLVDKDLQTKSKFHIVSNFNLMNQNGETITQKNYENKIYVVDFFFTRCQGPCPLMTNNMNKIQDAFLSDQDIMLLSLSVTPEIDTIPVLKEYANNNGVIDSKWNITTGNKKHIYNLARKSYFAVVEQGDGGLQDFIHTPNFILIDKEKQIRGIYDGTNNEDIKRIIEDIKILQN